MCINYRINNGICEGLQIEDTANFSVAVTISECTPELIAGGQRSVSVSWFIYSLYAKYIATYCTSQHAIMGRYFKSTLKYFHEPQK